MTVDSVTVSICTCQIENQTHLRRAEACLYDSNAVYNYIHGKYCRFLLNMNCTVQIRHPPNRGRSCCLVACPPGSRSHALKPPEGFECCIPCSPLQLRSRRSMKSHVLLSDDARCPTKKYERFKYLINSKQTFPSLGSYALMCLMWCLYKHLKV